VVSTAKNGAAALALAKQAPPQAILSDVMMPGMDGFQLALAVRQDPTLAGIPVVLASASYTEALDRKLAEAAGASALVETGADGREMIEALVRALDGSPPAREAPPAAGEEYARGLSRQVERQASINAGLTRRLAVREAELAILSSLTETLNAAPELGNAMEGLLYRCLDAAGVSKGAAYLIEPGGLRLTAQLGWGRSAGEGIQDLFGRRDLLDRAIERGEFIQISSETGGPEPDDDLLAKAGADAMAIAPLGIGNKRFGALVMAALTVEMGEDWPLFARAVGAQIGQALQLAHSVAELRENKDRLGRVIETLAEGLIIRDTKGRITSVNLSAEKILRTPRAVLLGGSYSQPAWQVSSLDGRPLPAEERPAARAARSAQPVYGAEIVITRPDGSQITASVNVSPLRDDNGEPAGTVSLMTDISDRKRWEKNLQEHARQQAAISELGQRALGGLELASLMEGTAHSVACTLEAEFCAVLEAPADGGNLLLRAGFGWDRALIGQPVMSGGADSMCGLALASRNPVIIDDIRGDARFLPTPFLFDRGAISGMAVPIPGPARPFGVLAAHSKRSRKFSVNEIHLLESVAHVLGSAIERKTDEIELARRAQELARYNTELEQFAYVAAHDLQEPLRTVASFTQLLAQRYRGRLDADADKFIDLIVGGAARMRQLIQDLLSYSRVALKETALQPTDVQAVFAQALAALHAAIEESGAVVTSGTLPTLRADPAWLDQVFRNLIGNALKFHGSEPPRVHVWAEAKDGEWIFGVRDNGIGIEPEYQERIFRIFERLHSRQSYPGTGMGLAICKRVVERHGGRMWVESEPGKGSTFYFTLPRSTSDVLAGPASDAAPVSPQTV
jgi:PAS domain S-box-containing protein